MPTKWIDRVRLRAFLSGLGAVSRSEYVHETTRVLGIPSGRHPNPLSVECAQLRLKQKKWVTMVPRNGEIGSGNEERDAYLSFSRWDHGPSYYRSGRYLELRPC